MAARRLISSASFRFSIRQLLICTAFVAIGCVALLNASPVWSAALLGLALLVVTAAVPLAIFRREADRAFWLGFALFGWLYLLVLAYGFSLGADVRANNPLGPYSLATTHVSIAGYERIYSGQPGWGVPQPAAQVIYLTNPDGSYSPTFTSTGYVAPLLGPVNGTSATPIPAPAFTGPTQDDFINVAHALWAVLLATLGGWFTRWLFATRPPVSATPESS